MERKNVFNKISGFLRRNVYYVVLFLCIAAVGTMVTLTVIDKSGNDVDFVNPPTPDSGLKPDGGNPDTEVPDGGDAPPVEDVVAPPILFTVPVVGGEMATGYSETVLVFSSTLKQWEVHLGVDYVGDEGANVVSAYGGVVDKITSDVLTGTVITVNHGNGLVTTYGGVDPDSVSVRSGDVVERGDVIATVGKSAMNEHGMGAHLHFETFLDGVRVNPTDYMEDGNK